MKHINSKQAVGRRFNLTQTQIEAIDYIGSHRKSGVKAGKHISIRMYNTLKKKRLIMDIGKYGKEKYTRIMLTVNGEFVFTALHPYSKYRIK